MNVTVAPDRVYVGQPTQLSVNAADPVTGASVPATVSVGASAVGSTGTPFKYTFAAAGMETWVSATGYTRTRVPLTVLPHGQMLVTLEPPRPPLNKATTMLVRVTDHLSGVPVTGEVWFDSKRVGATNTPFTATLIFTTTRVFDPDTRKWVIETQETTGEVRALTYLTKDIPFQT